MRKHNHASSSLQYSRQSFELLASNRICKTVSFPYKTQPKRMLYLKNNIPIFLFDQ